MRRATTGTYENTVAGGEAVRAFVPDPLPPRPPPQIEGRLRGSLDRALIALGRLDGVSSLLPDTHLFLYTCVRKEAVLSSQIEGAQSTLSDLLLFELEEAPGVPVDEVVEVSNYVAALEHGLQRLRGGFPLSNRLIREIHEILLSRGRGQNKSPGEFRRSQNWIGGSRPGNARFVPPPPHRAAETAQGAVSTARRLLEVSDNDRDRIQRLGRRAGSAPLVHHTLQRIPICTIARLAEKSKLTLPTVSKALDVLVELGVVREITGKKRHRIYRYDGYMNILDEGTEPL